MYFCWTARLVTTTEKQTQRLKEGCHIITEDYSPYRRCVLIFVLRDAGPADGHSSSKHRKCFTEVTLCNSEYMDSPAQRGHSLTLQFCWFKTITALKCSSPSSPFLQNHISVPSSLIPPLLPSYIMSTHPFGTGTNLSTLAHSCPAQARAKRLILAPRPRELSQLHPSFPTLSASISSNTLPGGRYGHQRRGWYFWPPCVWNYSAAHLCISVWRPLELAYTWPHRHYPHTPCPQMVY